MIKKAKKRSLFLLSLVITSLIGTLSGGLRSNNSQEGSLFISTVHADLVPWGPGWDEGGCGGCSAGCSGY